MYPPINFNSLLGTTNILLLVLDALRFDIAQTEFQQGNLPNFQKYLHPEGWEERYTPASFTYPAHKAFFAGFLPTRTDRRITERLFAACFLGSESSTTNTWQFAEAEVITALRKQGYASYCIGGVGFFNKQTAISCEFPALFEQSYWSRETSVVDRNSTELQFKLAAQYLENEERPFLLFINVSAIHQPNYYYCRVEEKDDHESHAAALRYVDQQLPILMKALEAKGNCFAICCSDHGCAYGEDDHWGHRNAHPTVMRVPYAHFKIGNF